MARMTLHRGVLIASVAVLPLLCAPPVLAQTADQTTPGPQPRPAPQAAPSPAASDELIVTATRREESVNRVPVSVSAFTTTKMDVLGVKSIGDLARFTPGVTFDRDDKNISIRGIDSTAGAGTTGVYIDDTPIQVRVLGFNSNNTLPAVFDLERVEVLRGPQGTLFGAGSEGGTVRYITPQPGLTRMSAYGRSEVSFTDGGAPSYEAGATVGGPIVEDKLGFRISAWDRRDGGWIDRFDYLTGDPMQKNANSQDTYVLRGAMTWSPVPGLLITPSIYYQKRNQHDTDTYWVFSSDPGQGQFNNGTPEKMSDRDRFSVSSLKASYDTGRVSFISNTSWYDRLEHVNGYSGTIYNLSYFQQLIHFADPRFPLLTHEGPSLPGFGRYTAINNTTNQQKNFTQELRVQSTGADDRINWVVGVFYARDKQESTEEIYDPQLPALTQYLFGQTMEQFWGQGLLPNGDDYINDVVGHDRQLAAFADVTWNVTDKLKLNAGLRYAKTKYDFTNAADGPQNFGKSGGSGQEEESPVTPKASISYQATPDDLFYVTVAKGYRIGGANTPFPEATCAKDLAELQLSGVPDSYKSDTVWSYEAGAKNRLFERRLSLSGSIFYVKWNDIQQSNYLPSCGFQYTANLGQAESKGFDLQAQLQATEHLRLESTVGYTDARYSADTRSGASQDAPIIVAKGDSLGVRPWNFSVAAQYDFKIVEHEAFVRLDYEYASRDPWLEPTLDPVTTSYDKRLVTDPETNFVSARAGVTLSDWDLSVFGDNLLNSAPQLDLYHEDAKTRLYTATTFRPRTIGVTATYRY